MAAALSALNAKIRSQPVLNYVCSTRTSKSGHLADTAPNSTDHRLTMSTPYRFLGPSLQLRHPDRSRNGHAERSRNVRSLPTFPAAAIVERERAPFNCTATGLLTW